MAHVHDLSPYWQHADSRGRCLAAELMTRMGHWSTRAAVVYLHAREERDRQIASTLDKMARREMRQAGIRSMPRTSASGTQRARRGRGRTRSQSDNNSR